MEGCELWCLAQELRSLLACWNQTTMVSGTLHLRLPTLVCLAQVGQAHTLCRGHCWWQGQPGWHTEGLFLPL